MNFNSATMVGATLRAVAIAAALALTLGAPAASAQPGGGMHGGTPIDQVMPPMLEQAKASLNLNTSQQVMWDNVFAQGKAAREAGRANRQVVKDALQTELGKAEPDLAAVAAKADAIEQQNRTQRQQVRSQWLALYATFSPEQKVIVRDLLQQRMARAESFRARIAERIRGFIHPPGS